ncbi:MAG: InlB B-repeat-containing protein [Clostridiales bacterium]|jgi:uncharacterized repeat protein (TIGR02543 family)|nr:InlB B-repeat-containing protein [Clostridiales bacterium]
MKNLLAKRKIILLLLALLAMVAAVPAFSLLAQTQETKLSLTSFRAQASGGVPAFGGLQAYSGATLAAGNWNNGSFSAVSGTTAGDTLKVTLSTQDYSSVVLYQTITNQYLQAGGAYTFSYDIYFDPSSRGTTIGVQECYETAPTDGTAQYKLLNGYAYPKGEAPQWKTVSARFKCAPAANRAFMQFLQFTENPASITFYLKNISIVKNTADPGEPDPEASSLKDAYASFFPIGNIVTEDYANDLGGAKGRVFQANYNAATVENAMKPEYLYQNEAASDDIVNAILAKNLKLHGHTLIWHESTPTALSSGGKSALTSYVTRVATHFKGKVDSWDVVNEAFNWTGEHYGGTGWRNAIDTSSPWYKSYKSADFIYDAFVAAKNADPDAKLYYNDYFLNISDKANAVAGMVTELNAKYKAETGSERNLIEGVGMQAHYYYSVSVDDVIASMDKFINAGVDIAISELNIAPEDGQPVDYDVQAAKYAELMAAYKLYSNYIDRVTLWGFDDSRNWGEVLYGLPDRGLTVLYGDLTAKPAYAAVLDPEGYLGIPPVTPIPRDSSELFELSYDANGASGTAPEPQTFSSNAQVEIKGAENLAKSGFSFASWNTQADGSGDSYSPGQTATFASSVTLYAQWDQTPTFTLTYNANGGSGTAPTAQSFVSGSSVTISGAGSLTRSRYIFAGWNTSANGSGTSYTAGQSVAFTANTTLYAKWTALPTYTVTYNANGGSGTAPTTQSFVSGSSVTISTAGSLTRSGYIFAGWNTSANGSGTSYTAGQSVAFTANTTLYAKWTALPSYTVTYNANGGSGTAPMAQSFVSGSSVTISGVGGLTRSGYIFAGWNTSANSSGTSYTAGQSVAFTANTTLYAKWTALPTYTVTYNANGGSGTAPTTQSFISGNSVTISGAGSLTRSGYIFAGWNTSANSSGTSYTAGQSVAFTANTTLYAKWTALPSYTVTYNANGGSGTTPTTQSFVSGSSVTISNAGSLTRSGYTFSGWNTSANGSGTSYTAGQSVAFTANTTLYAKWTALPSYTVTYNANGGAGTAPTAQSFVSGNSVTISNAGSLTRSGYIFAGWNTSANGSGTSYSAGATATFTANTTLYAKWTALPTYTVTYNANGGSGTAPTAQSFVSGNSVTISNAGSLTRSGYTFSGWNTSANGSGTSYTAGQSVAFTANTTLYAKWTALPSYTVTYNANGGSGIAPTTQSFVSGSSMTISGAGSLTRSGYIFAGWNTSANGSGTSYTAGQSVAFTANTTLYAKWTALPSYTVTYNANGGSGATPTTQNFVSGSSVTISNAGSLTRSGYIFAGWNTSANGSGTSYSAGATATFTANTTLYAKWTAVSVTTYTVTYKSSGGTGTVPQSQTFASGASVTISGPGGLTRSGYAFAGWSASSSGTGTIYAEGQTVAFTGNVTLYAKWIRQTTYTLSYRGNGGTGSVPQSQTFVGGNSVIINGPGGLSKSGHVFGGWNTSADGTGTPYAQGESVTLSGTSTLYAQWEVALGEIVRSWTFDDGEVGGWRFPSDGLVYGDGNGTVSIDDSFSHEGTGSLRLSGTANTNSRYKVTNYSLSLDLNGGNSVQAGDIFTAWIYLDDSSNAGSVHQFDQWGRNWDSWFGGSNMNNILEVTSAMKGRWFKLQRIISPQAVYMQRIGINFGTADTSLPASGWVDSITISRP